jgi:hypothetical protein
MAVSSIALVELDSEADKIERGRHLHADDFFLEIKASRGVDLKLGVERFEGCRFGKAAICIYLKINIYINQLIMISIGWNG